MVRSTAISLAHDGEGEFRENIHGLKKQLKRRWLTIYLVFLLEIVMFWDSELQYFRSRSRYMGKEGSKWASSQVLTSWAPKWLTLTFPLLKWVENFLSQYLFSSALKTSLKHCRPLPGHCPRGSQCGVQHFEGWCWTLFARPALPTRHGLKWVTTVAFWSTKYWHKHRMYKD